MKELVKKLIMHNKTISTMESCTGGALASAITDIEGSSKILKFSAITYSDEFKIKMGVDNNIINKYTVYSIETANEMSKKISCFTNSDYGIGITGTLNKHDPNNKVYFSIYDKNNNQIYEYEINIDVNNRKQSKNQIIHKIKNELLKII